MYSAEQVFLAVVDKNSASEVNLEQYIAGWELLAEDSEWSIFREQIYKGVEFLTYLSKNYECKNYQNVLDSIEYRKIDPKMMKYFVEEGYFSKSMIYYLRKGYPELDK
jgi:hypothetical protein